MDSKESKTELKILPMLKSEKELSNKTESKSTSIIYGCFRDGVCCYVGQHNTGNLKKRIKKHKSTFQTFMKTSKKAKGCPALYRAFNKYGFKTFEWKVLTSTTNRNEINQLENEYIAKYNTLSPNGYNLRLNGPNEESHTTFSKEILDKISENVRKANLTAYVNHRKHVKELEGLPQYVNYLDTKEGRKYVLKGHPKIPGKIFASNHLSNDELKQKMIDYIKKCEAGEYIGPTRSLPIGVKKSKLKGTYTAYISHKGKSYAKYFYKDTSEKNLQYATQWRRQAEQNIKDGLIPTMTIVEYMNKRFEIFRMQLQLLHIAILSLN